MKIFSKIILSGSMLVMIGSLQSLNAQNKEVKMTNPLLQKSALQYQAPNFSLIKDEHFKPAFEYGLAVHDKEIMAIADNSAKATFQNTVLALETSGVDLKRATSVFYNLTGSNTNPTLQALQAEYAPIFSAHSDKMYLNTKLYNRFKAVDLKALKGEDKKLTQYYLQEFELAGANLSDEDKEKMKKINEELASLGTSFGNKLLIARKNGAVLFDYATDLDGLSANEIAAAKAKATEAGHEGKYLIGLLNTTQQPLLQSLTSRTTREKLFKSSWTRAEKNDDGDTREVLEKMARLRLQKANLMGKKNFAEWKIQDQMAQTPERAMNLLAKIAAPAVAKSKVEAKEIQDLIDGQNGGFKLEPWDWNFYSEQVRKAKYDLDESEVKPYFELTTVLEKGVFFAAKKMYGITFKERKDLPVYHPDVVAYEVFDNDGKSIAIYYLDFYTRDNKNGGAWMNNFVDQSHYLKQKPVIVNVYNFAKPVNGNPSLISFDDVTTMFHEFGHTLHGLFANQNYTSLSGTAVPRDFVEFPSQINEHAALDPEVLKNYAIHYKTKEVIPQELIDKIKKAETFNKGYDVTELLAAATLDMNWHTVSNEADFKPALVFEKEALEKYGLLVNEVPTRYHTPYFAHIWSGGYSAGYYAYTWSKTLDYNVYDWMKVNGGMTRENCERFRKYILSVGNSVDLNQAFKEFIGHDMEIEPYLRNAGLSDK
ncbi:M3 family metallopeptidase [Flavobacterium sp. F-392]|uniref:Dipeptidyl carboxypeptidase n=2 Tax=Flavobacterium muglaense TaxID=2764716 RepID=A0A923SGP0_9FLAO|nr:M3 family metallopeptidase [Flavobacterium muglaense]MBC5839394.1 M3 family metallopeptidase [Flavobacterium muglaense]MBC5845906.1 M3 family metallopeptidase [Flavobacterium muglaense]